MFKEYAIDPKCMADKEYYLTIKGNLGFDSGRYLVIDRKKWAPQAMTAVNEAVERNEMGPKMGQSIKTKFIDKVRNNKFDGVVFPNCRRHIRQEDDWYEWVIRQNKYHAFSAIISSEGRDGTVSREELLEENTDWKISPSMRVKKNAKAIVDALDSLLRLSEELYFVDRFLCLYSHDIVGEIVSRIIKNDLPIKRITFITEEDTLPKGSFSNEYHVRNRPDLRVEMVIVNIQGWFHDRYLITDRGAVFIGQGFVKFNKNSKDWHQGKLQMGLITKKDADETRGDVEKLLKDANACKQALYP